MDYQQKYMDLLLTTVMNIQEGEALSINANPGHLEFAKELAQLASEITLQAVHVVEIEHGSPGEVVEVSPILHEQLRIPPVRAALLRIDDTEDRNWEIKAEPAEIAQSMVLLQQAGNLAPPQLDKQVAPWSIVPVPGPQWAKRLLGPQATEKELWEKLAPVFKLESDNVQQAWREHISLIDHRLAVLHRMDIESYEITNGAGTRLTIAAVDQSRWRGGVRKLDNGRAFLPYLPLDRMSMLVDRNTTTGIVKTTQPFQLLGGNVDEAVFEFSQGTVVSFDAATGKELIATALSIDEGAALLGECSLVEHGSLLSNIAQRFGYLGFDENALSTLTLGMGEALHLEALDTYADEFELQEKTGCNVSNLRVRIPIGDDKLTVTAKLLDGSSTIIMQNGDFLL